MAEDQKFHDSDCATNNGPALPPAPCDCSLSQNAASMSDEQITRVIKIVCDHAWGLAMAGDHLAIEAMSDDKRMLDRIIAEVRADQAKQWSGEKFSTDFFRTK